VLAKADPLNAASLLLAAFLVGYRPERGSWLLEPGTLVPNGVVTHTTPLARHAG